MIFNLQHTSVLKAQPDKVFPIYTFTCVSVTSPCMPGPRSDVPGKNNICYTYNLTLKTPIATKVGCFSRLLKCFRSLYGKQCGPRSVCSRSRLFASILSSSVMLGNYLQQTTSADDIFRCIFFLAL